MPDLPFDFILGNYLKSATDELSGTVVVEHKTFFPQSGDFQFKFHNNIVRDIKEYLNQLGYANIRHVFVFTALMSDLQRQQSSLKSEEKLILVKTAAGELNALYFSGCNLQG